MRTIIKPRSNICAYDSMFAMRILLQEVGPAVLQYLCIHLQFICSGKDYDMHYIGLYSHAVKLTRRITYYKEYLYIETATSNLGCCNSPKDLYQLCHLIYSEVQQYYQDAPALSSFVSRSFLVSPKVTDVVSTMMWPSVEEFYKLGFLLSLVFYHLRSIFCRQQSVC